VVGYVTHNRLSWGRRPTRLAHIVAGYVTLFAAAVLAPVIPMRIVLILVLLALLTACGAKTSDKTAGADSTAKNAPAKTQDSPIVGTWKRAQMVAEGTPKTADDQAALEQLTEFSKMEMEAGADVLLIFNADGTGSQDVVMPGQKNMSVPLRYTVEGQKLTITVQPGTKEEIAYRAEIVEVTGKVFIMREFHEPPKEAFPNLSPGFLQTVSRVWTLERVEKK